MTNARRIGRELALKALFQVDIGKQPLAEVVSSAEAQILQGLLQVSGQAIKEAQSEVRSLIKPEESDLSTQSRRQLRKAGTDCMNAMKSAAAHVETIVRHCIENPGSVDIPGIVQRVATATEIGVDAINDIVTKDGVRNDLVALVISAVQIKTKIVGSSVSRTLNSSVVASRTLQSLVYGVSKHKKELDEQITTLSAGWALDRQPAVDRNVLRIAIFELLHMPEIPAGVVINEAVDLAKKYSTADSGKFVNGVLGTLAAAQRPNEEILLDIDVPLLDVVPLPNGDEDIVPILFDVEEVA